MTATKHNSDKPLLWRCSCGKKHLHKGQEITVIAMRHGESQHNVLAIVNGDPKKHFHLTPKGRQQARALATKLKKYDITEIFASQMIRTQETAAPLAKSKGFRIKVDKRLNDIKAGGLEGVNIYEFRRLTGQIHASVKGSETGRKVALRLKSFLQDLIRSYSGQTVAIVSSEIILHSLKQIAHGQFSDELKGHHLKNGVAYRFTLHAPVVCLSCGDGYRGRALT